jgi:hypothetical protein
MAGLAIVLAFFIIMAIKWPGNNVDFKSIREDNERLAEIDKEQI